mgnify:CR=1 FL=1
MKSRIQHLIFDAGWSQAKLARVLGISEKSLSRKLTGECNFWWWEIVRICEIFQIENPLPVFPHKKN